MSSWNPLMIGVKTLSDAVFKGGTLNLQMLKNGNKNLTGDAIGIKYDGKTYYNLILEGNNVTVPGIKNKQWTIGTGK